MLSSFSVCCGNSFTFNNIVFNLHVVDFGLSAAPISLLLSTSSPASELEVLSPSSSDIDDATSYFISFVSYHGHYAMPIYILDTTNMVYRFWDLVLMKKYFYIFCRS